MLPQDVAWNWTLMRNSLKQESSLATAPGHPDTFLFRTRENGFGVLQILDATNPAPNVKIRYKLVQDGKTDAAKVTTNVMRALATRICEGDDAAFGELRLIATELFRNLDYAKEQARLLTNVILMRAAFNELGEQAGRSNAHALAALQTAAFSRPLKAHVPHALGIAATAGNEHALEMLLHPQDWNILLSSAVTALRVPAEQNNERAVDFLIGVLEDPKHRALWNSASGRLRSAAAMGNARAKAAVEKYQQAQPQ
jgi:hypothetical protein